LEETPRSSSPTINLSTPPQNHVPKLRIYLSFKYLQGWCINHFPRQPIPVLDNSFSEEIFPNILRYLGQQSLLLHYLILSSTNSLQIHRSVLPPFLFFTSCRHKGGGED